MSGMSIAFEWVGRTPFDAARSARDVRDELVDAWRADLITAGFHDDMAALVRSRIRERQEGVLGQPFVALSPRYAKFKRFVGRPSRPDLTLTGQTLDAISGMVINDRPFVGVRDVDREDRFISTASGTVRIPGGQPVLKVLEWHQEGDGNLPVRRGFGFTGGERAAGVAAATEVFRGVTFPRIQQMWAS